MIEEIKGFVEIQSGNSYETLEKLEKFFDGIAPALEALKEQRLLIKYLIASGVNHMFKIDTSLARGLDYYTGMIFEAVLQGKEVWPAQPTWLWCTQASHHQGWNAQDWL